MKSITHNNTNATGFIPRSKALGWVGSRLAVNGLAMAASLAVMLPSGQAMAHGQDRNSNVTGEVVVTKQIPGGTVTVGVGIGQPRPVVVEERRVVVVKERERPREVTVIHREPSRKVVIVREPERRVTVIRREPVRQVTVVKEYDDGKWYPGKYEGRKEKARERRGGHDHGAYHRYDDGKQKYVARADHNGSYRYFEDEHGVSIQEVSHHGTRDEYYRK